MVQTKKEGQRDLIFALRRGVITAAVLIIIFSYFVVNGVLGKGYLGVWGCVVCGLVAGIFLGFTTEYFTSHSFGPTRKLARSALTGPATLIIAGISLGMFSTVPAVILICLAVLGSFYLAGGATNYSFGLGSYLTSHFLHRFRKPTALFF